jgi:putative FmdB family regulatory protein
VPIYQYRCTNGHEFEVMQRMSEDPLTTCEVCGAQAARVLFAPAIHFKGSGFHNTDYGKKKGAGNGGASEGGGDSKPSESGSSQSKSSESKSSDSKSGDSKAKAASGSD